MTGWELQAAVAAAVSTADVHDLAERMDCSMLVARDTLEAEAVAKITGQPVDYSADWRATPALAAALAARLVRS